jgi:hypothetical protein
MNADTPLMGQFTESAAPPGFLAAVQRIEDQADQCYQSLAVLSFPRNLAVWATLTRIIVRIEGVIADKGYGSQAHLAVMLNLGRAGPRVIDWISRYGNKTVVPKRALKWEPIIFHAADQALLVAIHYDAFPSTFPLWHKNLLRAECVGSSVVRFTALGDESERRVRAYQQGLRPPGSRPKQSSSLSFSAAIEDNVKRKIAHIVKSGSKARSPLSFSYGKPKQLWKLIYAAQLKALDALFRRHETLDLGGYTVENFKRFYSGLLAICAVHENACHFRSQLQHKYPLDSAVLVRHRKNWKQLLARLTSLGPETIDLIIRDLTLGETTVLDLYVHPFISLNNESDVLGIIPHFPLNSRADENIIRVCSHLRPGVHDALSQTKEDEMRDELVTNSRRELRLRGPRVLPEPLPDADLIIEDAVTSTVVIAELKWLRKTIRPTEHSERQKEFLKGIEQLKQIEHFLRENPVYLQDRGDVSQDLRDVKNLRYILLARDYFVWVDPVKGYPVIDYEPLSEITRKPGSFAEQIRVLLRFDWLPVEGRDFRVSYDRATVNGVSVESQTVYANY